MARAKRTASTAIASQVEGLKSDKTQPSPPLVLNDAEMIYFDTVMTSREPGSWSANDLVIACNLAKTYRRLDELNRMLDERGYTQVNERGTEIPNPVFAALTQVQAQVQSLNRTLGLSASQRGLSGEHQDSRNSAARNAKKLQQKAEADALVA